MESNNSDKATNRKLIEETHTTVIQLSTVLLGVPGTDDKGLIGDVKNVKRDVNALYGVHRKLSLRLWVLIAFLAASGIISVGELTDLISLF